MEHATPEKRRLSRSSSPRKSIRCTPSKSPAEDAEEEKVSVKSQGTNSRSTQRKLDF
jgi:hypothetical protein